MYEDKMQRLGLTSGESRVYLALIELGSSTVGPVAKKSRVAYSKIYEVLERLIEKGLVSYTVQEKTKYFQAVEPVRIQEYLKKKEQEIQDNMKLLERMLPYLNRLSTHDHTHSAEIFTGNKGIMTAYDLLLNKIPKNGVVRFFYFFDPRYGKEIYDFYFKTGMFFRKTEQAFHESNIHWRGIVSRKKGEVDQMPRMPPYMKQLYVLFPIPGNIDIGEDSVLITAWSKNPVGILIHSTEIVENFRAYFDSLWNFVEQGIERDVKVLKKKKSVKQ